MRPFLCALLLLFPALCRAQETKPPELLAGVQRIVCLGDSITQGGEGPGGYVWLLRHYLAELRPQQPIEVINAGISGHKSNDMLARFQRDVLDKKPDLVTISVGVNDVWHGFYDFAAQKPIPGGNGPRGIPLDTYRKNVEEMVTRAQKAGAKVLILSTTIIHEDLNSPENARLVSYNRALHDLARKHKTLFVDYQKPFQQLIKAYRETTGGRDNFLTVDGVHMNAEGNRVMAHALLTGLGVTPEQREAVQAKVEQALREGK